MLGEHLSKLGITHSQARVGEIASREFIPTSPRLPGTDRESIPTARAKLGTHLPTSQNTFQAHLGSLSKLGKAAVKLAIQLTNHLPVPPSIHLAI